MNQVAVFREWLDVVQKCLVMMRVLWLVLFGMLISGLAGCATTGDGGLPEPRIRVGGLPYPGWTNYVALLPPHALGDHRYQLLHTNSQASDEVSSGIVYTRHAGFVDVAHVRSTVDWVRYVYLVTLERMMAPPSTLQAPLRWRWLGMDYSMQLHLPPSWYALPQDRRLQLAREASAVLAQRLATSISTWHEVGSWHGQMLVPPIREIRSAFTWDDGTSHVLAANVGARALAAGDPHRHEDWNCAVTRELGRSLAALAPVDQACQNEAIAGAQGRWWSGQQTLRRDFDTGLQGLGPKRPWLVQGLRCAENVSSASVPEVLPLKLPTWQALAQATGLDFESWFDWEVTMPDWLAQRVLGCSQACHAQVFKGEAALLSAVENVRKEFERTTGPEHSQP